MGSEEERTLPAEGRITAVEIRLGEKVNTGNYQTVELALTYYSTVGEGETAEDAGLRCMEAGLKFLPVYKEVLGVKGQGPLEHLS